MKLNINSITAQLYRWFYGTAKMPESLCPYFWKLILMWTFILPYAILCLPVIILERLDRSESHSTGERAGFGFLCWFAIFMAICMLSVFGLIFKLPTKDTIYMQLTTTGILGWALTIGVVIYQGFKYLQEKWSRRNIKYDENGWRIWEDPKEKEPSIVREFIKSSYNKYCPKIEWRHSTK